MLLELRLQSVTTAAVSYPQPSSIWRLGAHTVFMPPSPFRRSQQMDEDSAMDKAIMLSMGLDEKNALQAPPDYEVAPERRNDG